MAKKPFTVFLSHDVDHVKKQWFHYFYYFLKQKRLFHLLSFFNLNNPYWCFDRIMALEEKYGVRSTFYFLNESIKFDILRPKTWSLSLGRYRFSDRDVTQIIKKLDQNDWEIGLHGSYNSYLDSNLIKKEKKSLEEVLGHKVIGIRQHHLNLNEPKTWEYQKKAGFSYDASFGFKNELGFKDNRYQPFFPIGENFMVIPLALMDGNVLDSHYVVDNKNRNKIWRQCLSLIELAQKEKAVLSVLWHSRFFSEEDFPGCAGIYKKIIKECQKRGASFVTGEQICRKKIYGN